jgi:hypothetical protein
MRGYTDLWSRKIEPDLNRDDHHNVCQSLLRMRRVTMSHQKSCPRPDDSHDTARGANELSHLNKAD